MVVNFGAFKDLIDAIGGIDVNVPKPIRSNRFDCPYKTQAQCEKWPGWRFEKGEQHMNGQRALDLLADPRERARPGRDRHHPRRPPAGGDRRGHVEAHLARRRSSKLPFDGASYVKPLTTDLTRRAADPARLGEVPLVRAARPCTAGSAATSAAAATAARARTTPATLAMFLGQVRAAAADRPVRPRLRGRPHPAVEASALGRLLRLARAGARARTEPEPRTTGREPPTRKTSRRRTTTSRPPPCPSRRPSSCGRSPCCRSPSPCSAPPPDAGRAGAARHRTPRRPRATARSCRGSPRTDARSGTCTRRAAWERQGYQRPASRGANVGGREARRRRSRSRSPPWRSRARRRRTRALRGSTPADGAVLADGAA